MTLDFNSTNAKILAGIILSHIVVITACVMEISGKHFNELLLAELLTFCLGWAGIAYKQFAKKRDTFKLRPPETTVAADQERADQGAPATPAQGLEEEAVG